MNSYNIPKIQSLLKDFYTLTGIKTCLYDSDENELCFYPEKLTSFCKLLRENKEMEKRCLNCDKKGFDECKKTSKQYVYYCHAGLMECISPIIYQDRIIGYIVIGQIKPKNAHLNLDLLNLNEQLKQELSIKYTNLPTIDVDKISSVTSIINACAGYEYLKSIIKDGETKIHMKISNYIDDNISNQLSVEILCKKFYLSRSELYNIFNSYFKTTVAEYIKEKRLQKAYNDILNTKLPVNEIAIYSGIPDYNYFSKTFKKRYNISPTKLRKNKIK